MYPSLRVSTVSWLNANNCLAQVARSKSCSRAFACGIFVVWGNHSQFNWLSAVVCFCLTPKISYLKVRGRLYVLASMCGFIASKTRWDDHKVAQLDWESWCLRQNCDCKPHSRQRCQRAGSCDGSAVFSFVSGLCFHHNRANWRVGKVQYFEVGHWRPDHHLRRSSGDFGRVPGEQSDFHSGS